MEEYIGANLMIKTGTTTLIGILQDIDAGAHKMNVEVNGGIVDLDIGDIEEVEIITDEDSRLFKEEGKAPSREAELPFRDPAILQAGEIISKAVQSEWGGSKAGAQAQGRKEEDSGARKREEVVLLNKTVRDMKIDAPRKKALEFISYETFKHILEESDGAFGPSTSEVVYSGARGLLHLFVNIFKVMDRRFLVYTGDGIFAEIATVLARLCLIYNVQVNLILKGAPHARINREAFYYKSNGGVVSEKRSQNEDVVVIAGLEASEHMVAGAARVVFLGGYNHVPGITHSRDLVFFGIPTQDPAGFGGDVILCDVGLSPLVFAKYGVKRYSPKLLQKIIK